ncbi:MAG: carboxypeptidase-like regulatory domain-containing protein, partial [Phaeodactylibacter sp.]|nr:carboxypeptidase-like regulatory domain-containing protein [Phaeodactylibacter sp.]
MKKTFALAWLCLLPFFVSAQQFTQTVRGTVTDASNNEPLIGVEVAVYQGDSLLTGNTTDIDGNFEILNVPVGRYRVEFSYIGKEKITEEIEVRSARENFLEASLQDAPENLDVIEVRAKLGEPVNPVPVASGTTITPAQIELSTANAGDMGRFAMALPGVQATRDTRSDIIIRGNSPVGLLWRLEGIDIPNPNHFARRGSSGGGITIFSLSMLDRSDFSTGAFAPEYGNAFSGVFDVRFRKGNNQTREYTFKAGILGLDFATEGPFKQGGASYSMNYRYSTLGILNSIGLHLVGERIDNTFQDFSFKLNFPGKKPGNNISVWGIGGLSTEKQRPSDTLATFSDFATYSFTTNMGAMGLSHTWSISDSSLLKTSFAVMGQQVVVQDDTVNLELKPTLINREDFINSRISASTIYSKQISSRLGFKAGLFASNLIYNLQHDSLSFVNFQSQEVLSEQGNTFLLQPFFQYSYQSNSIWRFYIGAHAMYLALNNTYAVDPRAGLLLATGTQSTLSLAYGLHSRILPIGTYFTQVED